MFVPYAYDPRLILLALLSLASVCLYFVVNRGHARYYLETPLDRIIPFHPAFIVPYLSFLPLVPASLAVLYATPVAAKFYVALIIGSLSGSVVRFFIHAGMHQPRIRRRDAADWAVHWMYRHDARAHTFPSTHVLVTVVTCYFASAAFPVWAAVIWAYGSLIVLSTLMVKQHYLIDVFGGIAFAAAAIYLAQALVSVV
ncbi:MAG: phosphatase PAP2 family protein [Alphaproteobacteria bacterium]|nr:phosphatase PAP2 family protein [Alphaproteobacteria bacterium]